MLCLKEKNKKSTKQRKCSFIVPVFNFISVMVNVEPKGINLFILLSICSKSGILASMRLKFGIFGCYLVYL